MGSHLLLTALVALGSLGTPRAAPVHDAQVWVVSVPADPQVVDDEARPVEAAVHSVVEGLKHILRSNEDGARPSSPLADLAVTRDKEPSEMRAELPLDLNEVSLVEEHVKPSHFDPTRVPDDEAEIMQVQEYPSSEQEMAEVVSGAGNSEKPSPVSEFSLHNPRPNDAPAEQISADGEPSQHASDDPASEEQLQNSTIAPLREEVEAVPAIDGVASDPSVGAKTQAPSLVNSDPPAGADETQAPSLANSDPSTGAESQSLSLMNSDPPVGVDETRAPSLVSDDPSAVAETQAHSLVNSDLPAGAETQASSLVNSDPLAGAEETQAPLLVNSDPPAVADEKQAPLLVNSDPPAGADETQATSLVSSDLPVEAETQAPLLVNSDPFTGAEAQAPTLVISDPLAGAETQAPSLVSYDPPVGAETQAPSLDGLAPAEVADSLSNASLEPSPDVKEPAPLEEQTIDSTVAPTSVPDGESDALQVSEISTDVPPLRDEEVSVNVPSLEISSPAAQPLPLADAAPSGEHNQSPASAPGDGPEDAPPSDPEQPVSHATQPERPEPSIIAAVAPLDHQATQHEDSTAGQSQDKNQDQVGEIGSSAEVSSSGAGGLSSTSSTEQVVLQGPADLIPARLPAFQSSEEVADLNTELLADNIKVAVPEIPPSDPEVGSTEEHMTIVPVPVPDVPTSAALIAAVNDELIGDILDQQPLSSEAHLASPEISDPISSILPSHQLSNNIVSPPEQQKLHVQAAEINNQLSVAEEEPVVSEAMLAEAVPVLSGGHLAAEADALSQSNTVSHESEVQQTAVLPVESLQQSVLQDAVSENVVAVPTHPDGEVLQETPHEYEQSDLTPEPLKEPTTVAPEQESTAPASGNAVPNDEPAENPQPATAEQLSEGGLAPEALAPLSDGQSAVGQALAAGQDAPGVESGPQGSQHYPEDVPAGEMATAHVETTATYADEITTALDGQLPESPQTAETEKPAILPVIIESDYASAVSATEGAGESTTSQPAVPMVDVKTEIYVTESSATDAAESQTQPTPTLRPQNDAPGDSDGEQPSNTLENTFIGEESSSVAQESDTLEQSIFPQSLTQDIPTSDVNSEHLLDSVSEQQSISEQLSSDYQSLVDRTKDIISTTMIYEPTTLINQQNTLSNLDINDQSLPTEDTVPSPAVSSPVSTPELLNGLHFAADVQQDAASGSEHVLPESPVESPSEISSNAQTTLAYPLKNEDSFPTTVISNIGGETVTSADSLLQENDGLLDVTITPELPASMDNEQPNSVENGPPTLDFTTMTYAFPEVSTPLSEGIQIEDISAQSESNADGQDAPAAGPATTTAATETHTSATELAVENEDVTVQAPAAPSETTISHVFAEDVQKLNDELSSGSTAEPPVIEEALTTDVPLKIPDAPVIASIASDAGVIAAINELAATTQTDNDPASTTPVLAVLGQEAATTQQAAEGSTERNDIADKPISADEIKMPGEPYLNPDDPDHNPYQEEELSNGIPQDPDSNYTEDTNKQTEVPDESDKEPPNEQQTNIIASSGETAESEEQSSSSQEEVAHSSSEQQVNSSEESHNQSSEEHSSSSEEEQVTSSEESSESSESSNQSSEEQSGFSGEVASSRPVAAPPLITEEPNVSQEEPFNELLRPIPPEEQAVILENDADDANLAVQVPWLRVRSDVQLRYARTLVRAALHNPAARAQELQLALTLPDTGFITGLALECGGKAYKAYVRERKKADSEYQQAAMNGQTAAQVRQTSARDSSVLSLLVTVAPRSSLTVNLTYEELLTRRRGQYQHAVSVNSAQDVGEVRVDVFLLESRNLSSLAVSAAGQQLYAVDVRDIAQHGPQNFSSGPLAVRRDSAAGHVAHVRLQAGRDEQLALWPSQTQPQAASLAVSYDVDRSDAASGDLLLLDGYFVHFFAPPEVPPLRKHAIFVLDTSGSMWGHKLRQLQTAMGRILDSLHPDDFFSIVQFASHVTEWSPHTLEVVGLRDKEATLPANKDHINKAKKFINSMEASGGTNIGGALRSAVRLAGKRDYDRWPTYRAGGADLPQPLIIFLTDGLPTVGTLSLGRVLAQIRAQNAEIKAAIFSLSFGTRSNWRFLQRLSLQNNGFARRIYEAGDATQQLQDFYQEIASPLLANVTFNYVTTKVDGSSVTRRSFPIMYGGSELVVAGRVADGVTALEAEVEAWGAAPGASAAVGAAPGRRVLRATADIPGLKPPLLPNNSTGKKKGPSKPTIGVLERLWAYLSVKQLLDADLMQHDDDITDEPPKLEPSLDQPRRRALYLALKYGFVTRLTSLVVVKPLANDSSLTQETPVRPVAADGAERDAEGFPITNKLSEMSLSRPPVPGHIPLNFQPLLLSQQSENATHSLPLTAITWLSQHTDSAGRLRVGAAAFSLELPSKQDLQRLMSAAANQCPGRSCRPLASCVQHAVANSFMVFRDYFCPLGMYAGVCCSY